MTLRFPGRAHPAKLTVSPVTTLAESKHGRKHCRLLAQWPLFQVSLTCSKKDAEEIVGPKGKHEKERRHNHWGSTDGELSFSGGRIQVSRPRVRSKSGTEASLPHFEAFREEDPLPERVLNQILVGVSTRGYESSLDKPAVKLKSRGTSKSAASCHLVSQTKKARGIPGETA